MRHFYDSTLSELDFEQLPPALRRKFFSSLERLRLAQDGAFPLKPSSHDLWSFFTAGGSCSHLPGRLLRRSFSHLDNRLTRSASAHRNRLRRPSGPSTRFFLVSQQEVEQFAALPPTLQRKQFSREHQILLASRISNVILDAADEAVYKQFWSAQSRSSASVTLHELSSEPTFSGHEFYDLDDDDDDDDDMNSTMSDLQSFRWLDEHQDLDLSLHDYHAVLAETAARHSDLPASRRSKRSLSFTNLSFSRTSLDKKFPSGRTSLPSSIIHSRSVTSITPTKGHRRNKGSVSSLEPAATHYQDPAARAKLRVYLASPQKFDEAIEFGFPSMQDPTTTSRPPTRPRTSSRPTEQVGMTFLDEDDDDDTPSLSDGDDREYEDVDSPRTPSASAFSQGVSNDSNLDRSTFRPKITRDFLDPYSHGSAANREMTLHMTLTRPDLRSPDDTSSTRKINSVPLEQPQLVFPASNPTSFWDSLPDDESKVKKLFRKLKLRS